MRRASGVLRVLGGLTQRCSTSSTPSSSRFPAMNSRRKRNSVRKTATIEDIVEPRKVKHVTQTAAGMGEWIGSLDNTNIHMSLDEFMRRPMVRQLAKENGINDKLFMRSFKSFREYCTPEDLNSVDPGLLILLSDISKGTKDCEMLYPFFLDHAKQVFPHLEAMDDLRIISDLTRPHNWYPEARSVTRKIFFHAGPTNSGKTYHALKRFGEAKSAVFCGPLKLLAAEVFHRTNELGIPCDLVTGEERRFAKDNHHPSQHLSSTVEMLSTQMRVEVAVIDEIQMLRDEQRGWAWTRALLGAAADEIHLCGEPAAIDIVKKLLEPIGETVEVRYYERKSPLAIADKAIESYSNIEPGDCIVCFSKRSIFFNSKKLEENGIKPAVIYGDLPPGTKLAQAAKFNDPDDECNVLVATDAIGMGLNLNIRRVIFNSCTRQTELLPTYAALQIAGRAGRFGTAYANGVATTMRKEDLGTLKAILSEKIEPIANVGIAPTYDQIETFSFHLPQASFVRLLDLFVSVCSVSDHFFICTVYDMRELAVLIDQIPLPLKVRYTFCTSPLNTEDKRTSAVFVKMARRFSTGQALTYEWLIDMLEWPPKPATTLNELSLLEQNYEILDQYMWLSMRFPDMLPDEPRVREASKHLDSMIQEGVESFMSLLSVGATESKAAGSSKSSEGKRENPSKSEREKPNKRSSILEALLKRADISEDDLEQLREELNKNKKTSLDMEQEFFFPPPKKSDGPVVACVVEKKGDGTRTSMRQNEIYAYSAQIRTGDGCMVMPKIHWNSFEPSDWVSCTLEYVNKANQIKEKEMLEISKVPAENFDRFGMPPTRFENGIVQIKTLFVACPEFIKNRETRNAYGSYKKLFILNIGLGFVSTRRTADGNLAEKVKNGDVYTGIFEFRAKDNGAINFNHRGRVRDETNHVIERDAMWELTKTSSVAATDVQKKQMKEAIEQLRKDAEQFEREFKDSQSRPVAPMLPPNEISENRKEINLGLALPSRHSQPSIRTVDVVTTTPAQMMPTASSFRIPFAQVSKAPVVAPSSQLQQQQQQPCSSNQTARIGNFLERDQVRGNLLGVPLSSSTPRGSPELLRRREVTADDGNITSNTAVMLRDNNANPMNRRRPS